MNQCFSFFCNSMHFIQRNLQYKYACSLIHTFSLKSTSRSLHQTNNTEMKFLLLAVFLVLAISNVRSAPVNELHFEEMLEPGLQSEEMLENDENKGVRQRRLTCDLLSFEGGAKGVSVKFNDSACAANCLSMGKAGGRCNGGICECRKTTFKDLWDKRFG